MSESVRPDEAAQALREIGRRREQIVDVATVPPWYWWSVAVLMTGFAAAADTRSKLVIGLAAIPFGVGIAGLTIAVVAGQIRARVRTELLGWRGPVAILAFVALTLLVSLPTAFILDARHVSHPAVIGVGLGALVMAFGGPVLMRRLRRVMLNQADVGRS